jgi:TolB protein
MNLDGSDPHREVTPIKDLIVSIWSPDGKKVFFMKEGDNKTTYLANSDGSNEIALPLLVGNSDWAPDSSKFVYETKFEGNAEIFLYTVATRQNVNLTHNKHFNADPSFSPDGKRIAFLSTVLGDNPDIYVMDVDGTNIRRLTDHPAWDSYPIFTPDGTQILFLSNRDSDSLHPYIKNVNDDTPPVRLGEWNGIQGFRSKYWSPDGTQIVFSTDSNGKDQIVLMDVELYKPKVFLSDSSADLQFPRVSADGTKIAYQARKSNHSVELRVTELETQKTSVLYTTNPDLPPTFSLTPAWSPDGSKIVFSTKTTGNADIYTIKTDGTGLRQLTDDPAPDLTPSYSPDAKEIFFARDFYGVPRLFRMNADGSDARRVTDKSGYELFPAVSPDGRTLLFSGDRVDGRSKGLDIFSLDLSEPGNERIILSRPFHDVEATYSPDGEKIVLVSESDGNQEIYLMNADGSGLLRLTRNKATDTSPTFSADGKSIIFSSNRNGKFELLDVDVPQ